MVLGTPSGLGKREFFPAQRGWEMKGNNGWQSFSPASTSAGGSGGNSGASFQDEEG